MGEPTPIDATATEPSHSEELWYPGLKALALSDSLGLMPVGMIFLHVDDETAHELHVRRTSDSERPYEAWIERLTSDANGVVTGARLVQHTVCEGTTPYEAAIGASIAAGWITSADVAEGRQSVQKALAVAARLTEHERAEGRHQRPGDAPPDAS